jgi:hypothetical protein
MEKINRNRFFGTLGKGAVAAVITAAIPFKFFSNLSKASRQKKIQVVVHPSAIKRNGKV